MKRMTAIFALLLLGVTAQACPDLEGSYRCQSPSRSYDMVIAQEAVGENMKYVFLDPHTPNDKGDVTITDGVLRKEENSASVKNKTIKGWCEGEKLLDVRTGDYYMNGEYMSSFELSSTFFRQEGNLIWKEEGTMTLPVNRQTVCRPR
jgi:hypothetical protein